MAADKNNQGQKVLNVPTLRFPEFSGEWEIFKLKDLCGELEYGMNAAAKPFDGINKYIRITDIDEKTLQYSYDSVVSPDAEIEEKFRVRENDILFARTGASTGKTYIYDDRDGVLFYAGFLIRANVKHANSRFTFYQTQIPRYKKWVGIMSARSGQPGINSQEFGSYSIYLPSKQEQEKVSSLLRLLDERIVTQNKIIEDLKSLIKGLTQQLQKKGVQNGTWKKILLSQVLTERNEQNDKRYPVHSVSVTQGVVNQIEYLGRSFAAKDTSNYHVARLGNIIYTKSPTGDFPYGIIKRCNTSSPAAISPLYGVYNCVSDDIAVILHFYFASPINAINYLHPLIQKGAKNTINITNERFLENQVVLPTDDIEASKAAMSLLTLQEKIDIEVKQSIRYQEQKQYLLRTMFI